MTSSLIRLLGAGLACVAATALLAPSAVAKPVLPPDDTGEKATVQLLSFNDFHGRLAPPDGGLSQIQDPSQTPVGGAEYLATALTDLRDKVGYRNSITVAAGDLIGGSPFLSGLFHDEPSIEAMNGLGLNVSSVGNHEFDEGTTELLRIQNGGCHPKDGCFIKGKRYRGADFQYLAANVVNADDGETLLPGTAIREVDGIKIGFIGMTLKATATLVNPAGVASVEFKDEVETANAASKVLQKQGVKSIVVLVHEGGYQEGNYRGCEGISGPIVTIASRLSPRIDAVVTGHTHQPYTCNIPDPKGNPRTVTSAAEYGKVVTETNLVINSRSGDVIRTAVTSSNHLVEQKTKDAHQTRILQKWEALAEPRAARVVGSVAEDITGDASGNRAIETPMADLVADAILAGTSGDNGGAQIALMNVGGVRASLKVDTVTNGESPGEVTYAEAYAVAPFGNTLTSMGLTGAQLKKVLEQQYQPVADRGSRPMLALGISQGFAYEWDASQPQGSRVVAGSMTLNGKVIDSAATYRVATLNFLADGGDLFTAFTEGKDRLGGPDDLTSFVEFLQANPGLTAPSSRVRGL